MTRIFFSIVLLFAAVSIMTAQSPADVPDASTTQDQEVAADTELETQTSEAGGSSVVDGILGNAATHLGFSFASYQLYTTNSVRRPVGSDAITMTMFYPQIFSNLSGRRTQFHFDYGIGYRAYLHKNELNALAHSTSSSLQLRLARYTYLQLTDTFSANPNDYGFAPTNLSQTQVQPLYSQEVLVDRQRLLKNSAGASLAQRLGRRTNVTVFASYDYLRYSRASFSDTQGIQAGVRSDHQITSWLHLDNSYSTYLNAIDDNLRSSDTHRFEVGGFRFQITRSMQFFASGTIEYARYMDVGHTILGFDAAVTRKSRSNTLAVSYHRGFSTTLGPGTILDGHNALASLTQRLSQRLSVQMDASYSYGSGFEQNSSMESISGSGGLQVALHRNVVVSTNVAYVSQRISNLPFAVPNLHRYTVYAGLQYFLPALRGR